MADSLFSAVCSFAFKQLGTDGLDLVLAMIGEHFSDHGQRLNKALKESNEKAWKAVEIALAGETLWTRLGRAEDRVFRRQLTAYLQEMPLPELQGKDKFRKQCLMDLHDAKRKALLIGRLVPEEVARRAGRMADRADPQAVLAAEKEALGDIAADFKKAKLEALAWVLEQQPQPGRSVLVVAVRYYFQRQVEEDAELARRLQFTAMEGLTEAQQKGFQALDEGLKTHAARVEEAVAGLAEVAGEILDATLDLRAEMETMHGENKEFYARVLQMLERQQMHQRPVHAGDSLSIRSDLERQKVKEYLARYRRMPEEDKRAAPALLNGLGKLQVAAGDYQGAQEAFTRVAEISPDSKACAEGHYNAYRAALERAAVGEGSYPVALAELKMALRFDAARFAPFPPEEYEPLRILGAGGFGVTFLCIKKLTQSKVAVKALQAEGLERDVGAVLQEASTLDQIEHPAIIRLRHCGYADAARTRPFLEMDYFESQTLEEHVRQHGRLSVGDVLAVARPLAEALRAAHGKGILHRDVKPANLLVRKTGTGWEVRVIDFGLALKQSLLEAGAGSSSGKSMTGAEVAGTRHYAAPEQMGELPGVRVGPRADVYGFAKTCCYALFQNTEPTLLDYEKAPRALATLLSRCLARTPPDRPADFGEVLQRLDEITQKKSQPPGKDKPTGPEPPPVKSKPPVAPIIHSIDELLKEEAPHALPVQPAKYPDAIPAGKSSRRLPKPPPPPPPAHRSQEVRPAPPKPPPLPGKPDQAVKAPALALLAVCVLSVLANGGMLALGTVEMGHELDVPSEAAITWLLLLIFTGVSAAASVTSLLMLLRKQYTLSLIGCFLAMAPIGFCCVGGLPVGIWAVMTLLKPEVRGTFT